MKLHLVLVCLLSACASSGIPPAWTKPGATDADMRAMLVQCRAEASKLPLAPRMQPSTGSTDPNSASVGNPVASAQEMADYRNAVNACMSGAGWTHR